MTIRYVDAIQEQVTASQVTIYTAPTVADFESAHVIYSTVANESTADVDLTINVVQSGGSAAVTNRYIPPRTIFSGSSDPLSPLMGRVLKAGDFISTIATTAAALNLSIGIQEIYTDS